MVTTVIGLAAGAALGVLVLILHSYIRSPVSKAKTLSFAGSIIGGLLLAAGIVGLIDALITHLCILNLVSSIILFAVGLFFVVKAFFLAKIERKHGNSKKS